MRRSKTPHHHRRPHEAIGVLNQAANSILFPHVTNAPAAITGQGRPVDPGCAPAGPTEGTPVDRGDAV